MVWRKTSTRSESDNIVVIRRETDIMQMLESGILGVISMEGTNGLK